MNRSGCHCSSPRTSTSLLGKSAIRLRAVIICRSARNAVSARGCRDVVPHTHTHLLGHLALIPSTGLQIRLHSAQHLLVISQRLRAKRSGNTLVRNIVRCGANPAACHDEVIHLRHASCRFNNVRLLIGNHFDSSQVDAQVEAPLGEVIAVRVFCLAVQHLVPCSTDVWVSTSLMGTYHSDPPIIKHPAVETYLPSPSGFFGTGDVSNVGMDDDGGALLVLMLDDAWGERTKDGAGRDTCEAIEARRAQVEERVARAVCCSALGCMGLWYVAAHGHAGMCGLRTIASSVMDEGVGDVEKGRKQGWRSCAK